MHIFRLESALKYSTAVEYIFSFNSDFKWPHSRLRINTLISGPKKHLRLESDLGNTIVKSNCCRARAHVPLIEINHNDFNWKKRWENIFSLALDNYDLNKIWKLRFECLDLNKTWICLVLVLLEWQAFSSSGVKLCAIICHSTTWYSTVTQVS